MRFLLRILQANKQCAFVVYEMQVSDFLISEVPTLGGVLKELDDFAGDPSVSILYYCFHFIYV